MHRIISEKRRELADICRRYHVKTLEVFGSAARSADFNDVLSDADFLVEFERPNQLGPLEEFFGLQAALAELLGRPVDLVEPAAVRNPYVLSGINEAREIVYAA
jgi:hypothetical protein